MTGPCRPGDGTCRPTPNVEAGLGPRAGGSKGLLKVVIAVSPMGVQPTDDMVKTESMGERITVDGLASRGGQGGETHDGRHVPTLGPLVEPGSRRQTYLTSGQVAERLNVRPKTIARWADSHRLTCTYTIGRHRRFRPADIDVVALEMGSRLSSGGVSATGHPAKGRAGDESAVERTRFGVGPGPVEAGAAGRASHGNDGTVMMTT